MKSESKTTPIWFIHHLKSPVDGILIRYADRPVTGKKLNILFLNGRSEWIEKYEDLPNDTKFGEDAYWVTMDHRGQGASEGLRSHVKSYDDFATDVEAVVKATFKDEPYVIVAHSMGGLIALYGTMTRVLHPQSLSLFSPLFGMLMPMPTIVARMLAGFMSIVSFLGNRSTGAGSDRRKAFERNPLTQSHARFNLLNETQYKANAPTYSWVHATFRAFTVIFSRKYLKDLKIPISLMAGEEDLVVDRLVYEPWMKAWKEASGKTLTFETVPNARHELLNEDDRYRNKAITFLNDSISVL
ncbi:MAG: alpha/beta hydrolase [Chitinophagaceae bacterium]|nr:alpha/beta hydrolase [Oligoflexus sp.]